MAVKRRKSRPVRRSLPEKAKARPSKIRLRTQWPILALTVAVVVFYWRPLTSADASIQWDAADHHYSVQKYFSESVLAGKLPHWTPYVFSGYPFLADPQTGAWYPLNWPFFLFGITPGALQLQLALHCLIAVLGMYWFTLPYVRRREAAMLAGIAYGFGGFFAGHSSHVGMFQTAAWLPLLLLTARNAISSGKPAWMALSGVVVGVMVLAGHFQTAVYSFFAAGLFCLGLLVSDRKRWAVIAVYAGVAFPLGVLISAVQVAPGLELLGESARAGTTFTAATNSPLVPSALATLAYPNALGALEGQYHGPADITQFYFYAGFLLLPLAALGMRNSAVRVAGLALVVPALWYAFGPAGGLYRVAAKLPGLAQVRAPVHMWFVVAFGLALLAGAGLSELLRRWDVRYLALGLPLLCFLDVYYWNSAQNPLAYARVSFEQTYGAGLTLYQSRIANRIPPLSRFHAPYSSSTFGPQNHPLDARAETTYGYNPLVLSRYAEYLEAAKANPKLLDGLNVGLKLNVAAGALEPNDQVLPRAYFPESVVAVDDMQAAKEKLGELDPAVAAVAVVPAAPDQDPSATATITEYREDGYVIHYRAARASLLRLAVPRYPGWRATIDGKQLPVVSVDYALMGVVVPAGEGDLRFDFRSSRFRLAGLLSLAAALASAGVLWWRRRELIDKAG